MKTYRVEYVSPVYSTASFRLVGVFKALNTEDAKDQAADYDGHRGGGRASYKNNLRVEEIPSYTDEVVKLEDLQEASKEFPFVEETFEVNGITKTLLRKMDPREEHWYLMKKIQGGTKFVKTVAGGGTYVITESDVGEQIRLRNGQVFTIDSVDNLVRWDEPKACRTASREGWWLHINDDPDEYDIVEVF